VVSGTVRKTLIELNAAPCSAASDVACATQPGPAAGMTNTEQIGPRGLVCVVDDDAGVCDSLSVLLETYGFAVLTYPSGPAFLQNDGRFNSACLIVDQHMPGLGGLDVVAELHRQEIFRPTILITGRLDAGISQRAGELRVLAILEKPFPVARLVELVRGALAPQAPEWQAQD
jgi:FixJ family two-component response regulator